MRSALVILLAVLATPAPAAEAGPVERLALVAGASDGGPGRPALRYAASDARQVARVLSQLGGVDDPDLVLLEDPDAAALREAIGKLGRRAAAVRAAGRRTELFVYYSGHSDEDGLLLGATRLAYADLRRDLDAVPAEVRVAILDSCESGAFTRVKGGQMRPAFQVDAASQVRGHAFLTSSAADEASQESDRLRASFFTHALLTGLRGAADATGDGLVTLNEAYQFAFRETLARTEATQSGPQHATYDISLVGSGEVVMTDLRRAGAVLVLPEAISGKVFVRSAAGQLVAELAKLPGARIDLALDPGDYRIRVARERRLLEARLSVAAAERALVAESLLEPVQLERTAARGDLPPDEDGLGIAAAPPAAEAAGRNVVSVAIGAVALRGDHGADANGNAVRTSDQAGMLVEIGYARWLGERLTLESAFVARGIEGQESKVGDTTTSQGSVVAGFTLGAKYWQPLSPRHRLFLGVSGGVGAFGGLNGSTTTASGGEKKKEAGTQEWVPGARARLSLDYFATRRVQLALAAGYDLVGRFRHFVGGRRDHSGFAAALSVGFAFGG